MTSPAVSCCASRSSTSSAATTSGSSTSGPTARPAGPWEKLTRLGAPPRLFGRAMSSKPTRPSSTMSSTPATVVCFGEILWDFLPRGAFPGGAPFNVAYHLHRSGLNACLVSAVGRDVLGDELLRRLRHWSLSTDGVNQHASLPTGYVRAVLNAGGDATYEIAPRVAWDEITPAEGALRSTREAKAIVFGSLALRSAANRTALNLLLDALPASALRVFDINLRPPFDDLSLVREIARRATLI